MQGKQMMYDYCQERGIPYKRCSKLIVANDIEQLNVDLPKLIEFAEQNGVNDLKLLSKDVARMMRANLMSQACQRSRRRTSQMTTFSAKNTFEAIEKFFPADDDAF